MIRFIRNVLFALELNMSLIAGNLGVVQRLLDAGVLHGARRSKLQATRPVPAMRSVGVSTMASVFQAGFNATRLRRRQRPCRAHTAWQVSCYLGADAWEQGPA